MSDVPSFPMERTLPLRPPPEYTKLRKEKPIKAKIWDGSLVWLVTRHADVNTVLSDPRFSKIRTHPGFPETGPGGKAAAFATKPTFVDMDPPEHTRHRGMVAQDFTVEKVESMRPDIQKIVDQVIDDFLKTQKQPVDLHEAFSMPVPTLIIYKMLGIPYEDHEFLHKCNSIRTNGSATSAESSTASNDLMEYLGRLVDKKTKEPTNDIISRLAIEQVGKGHLTRDELVAMSFLLLVAGNATTANMITLGVLTLLQHPDQLAELRAKPELIKDAVEEIFRFLTGSQFATRRIAIEDVEVGGIVIKKGEGVWALNASANEDESVFSDPTRFDIHRKPNPHLAFGAGIHVCVAEDLARAEVQVAIITLIRRLPNLQLAVSPDQLEYVTKSSRDFGVTSLPIKW